MAPYAQANLTVQKTPIREQSVGSNNALTLANMPSFNNDDLD